MKKYFYFSRCLQDGRKVYNFRNTNTRSTTYYAEKDESKLELLKKFNGMKVTEFNKWFNKMFEKHKLKKKMKWIRCWFRNTERRYKKVSKMNLMLFEQKSETRALVKRTGLEELGGDSITSLTREKPQYDSGIFSKLRFEDLKAHTEA